MRGGRVDLARLGFEVPLGEPERAQPLQHDAAAPVHGARRELQVVLDDRHLEAPGQLARVALVVAPELRPQHAARRGHHAEARILAERAQDAGDVAGIAEQLAGQLLAPPLAVAGQLAVRSAPLALLGVHLQDQQVRIEDAAVRGGHRRPDVPPVVVQIQDAVRPHHAEIAVQREFLARRVGDDQVVGHRDGAQRVDQAGQQVDEVDVHQDADRGRLGEPQTGVGPPDVRIAGDLAPRRAHHPGVEGRRLVERLGRRRVRLGDRLRLGGDPVILRQLLADQLVQPPAGRDARADPAQLLAHLAGFRRRHGDHPLRVRHRRQRRGPPAAAPATAPVPRDLRSSPAARRRTSPAPRPRSGRRPAPARAGGPARA